MHCEQARKGKRETEREGNMRIVFKEKARDHMLRRTSSASCSIAARRTSTASMRESFAPECTSRVEKSTSSVSSRFFERKSGATKRAICENFGGRCEQTEEHADVRNDCVGAYLLQGSELMTTKQLEQ